MEINQHFEDEFENLIAKLRDLVDDGFELKQPLFGNGIYLSKEFYDYVCIKMVDCYPFMNKDYVFANTILGFPVVVKEQEMAFWIDDVPF